MLPSLPLKEGEGEEEEMPNSRYREAEVRSSECMQRVRELITELDALPPDGNRMELQRRILQSDSDLRRSMDDAKRLSIVERQSQRYQELNVHYAATQQLVQTHCGGGGGGGGAAGFTVFSFNDIQDEPVAREGTTTPYNVHQDPEFMQFFSDVHQKDVQMDEALDRIHFGVMRVGENAQGIKTELDTQNHLLKRTDTKVQQQEEHVKGMNKKIKKAIKQLGKSRIIAYAILCVILIVLIIVIIVLAKSF